MTIYCSNFCFSGFTALKLKLKIKTNVSFFLQKGYCYRFITIIYYVEKMMIQPGNLKWNLDRWPSSRAEKHYTISILMVPSPLICKNAKIFTSVHDCCMPGLRFPYPEFVILVNGHISTTESSRSATPDTYNAANTSTATSTPSHTSRLKVMAKANGNKKRSKSTSPSRKIVSSVAKQKDMFKQIQQKADRVDWILHPKKS